MMLKTVNPSTINPDPTLKAGRMFVCSSEIPREYKHLPKSSAPVFLAGIWGFLTEKQEREKSEKSAGQQCLIWSKTSELNCT